jgi:hypothetical protein
MAETSAGRCRMTLNRVASLKENDAGDRAINDMVNEDCGYFCQVYL